MTEEGDDDKGSKELHALLSRWKVEAPSEGLSDRMRRSYRAELGGASRSSARRIVLPLPLAALIAIGLLLLGALAGRGLRDPSVPGGAASEVTDRGGLANLRPLDDVHVRIDGPGGDDARP